MLIFLLILLLIIIGAIIAVNVRIVPQADAWVIERLGVYSQTWNAGLHVKTPFIDRVINKASLKEQVLDFPPQPVITKDNVTMLIDSVVFCLVFDPKLFTYGVENPMSGLQNLAATTLRQIVGSMELDETLTGRDTINNKMRSVLDTATDPWGIKVTRVEIKNIQPPKEIEEVMTTQMRAERVKRQAILEAEAHKISIIEKAEGDKRAKVLSAEAERDAQVALAEGRARSIELIYSAEAEGLRKLNSIHINEPVLKLKGIEALKDVSNGRATKIFMPSDITSVVSALGVAGEALGIGDSTPIDTSEAPFDFSIEEDDCITNNKNVSDVTRQIHATSARIQDDLEIEKSRQ